MAYQKQETAHVELDWKVGLHATDYESVAKKEKLDVSGTMDGCREGGRDGRMDGWMDQDASNSSSGVQCWQARKGRSSRVFSLLRRYM